MRRLGVVVLEPAAELGQDGLGIPKLGAGHVVALEGADKRLSQAVALGLYAGVVIGTSLSSWS